MMGERTVAQEALFYSFNLERHVPQDHLLRSIDRFVDLSGIREHLQPFYSSTGRPSVDPELMIRMLIIGYCMGMLPHFQTAPSWRDISPTSPGKPRYGLPMRRPI